MAVKAHTYDLHRVVLTQKRIADALVLNHSRDLLDREVFGDAVAVAADALGVTTHEGRLAVARSLVDLVDTKLDPLVAATAAWRLAGNTRKLRRGQAVCPWAKQAVQEWVPIQIRAVEPCPRRIKGEEVKGGIISCFVMAGSPAGVEFTCWWPTRYAMQHRSAFGFSRPRSRPDRWPPGKPFLPMEDITQLTRFRLLALVDPKLTRDNRPGFKEWRCTPAHVAWNQKLIRLRRRELSPCPIGSVSACHRCPVGYDRCPAGCHPTTYVQKETVP